jgi:hypothetical protein
MAGAFDLGSDGAAFFPLATGGRATHQPHLITEVNPNDFHRNTGLRKTADDDCGPLIRFSFQSPPLGQHPNAVGQVCNLPE